MCNPYFRRAKNNFEQLQNGRTGSFSRSLNIKMNLKEAE